MMDEKEIQRILLQDVGVITAKDYLEAGKTIMQMLREAGWHSKSECLKGLDLEKMPDVSTNKADYFKDPTLPHYEEFNQGVDSERQACIDWLKEQLQGGKK